MKMKSLIVMAALLLCSCTLTVGPTSPEGYNIMTTVSGDGEGKSLSEAHANCAKAARKIAHELGYKDFVLIPEGSSSTMSMASSTSTSIKYYVATPKRNN